MLTWQFLRIIWCPTGLRFRGHVLSHQHGPGIPAGRTNMAGLQLRPIRPSTRSPGAKAWRDGPRSRATKGRAGSTVLWDGTHADSLRNVSDQNSCFKRLCCGGWGTWLMQTTCGLALSRAICCGSRATDVPIDMLVNSLPFAPIHSKEQLVNFNV